MSSPLDLSSVKDGGGNKKGSASSRGKSQSSSRPGGDARGKSQMSNRPDDKKGVSSSASAASKGAASKDSKGKDVTSKDTKDASAKSSDAASGSQRKPSPRGDAKGGSKKVAAGKKKDSDRESKKKEAEASEMEPTPMVSLRPLVLRKTIELNSDKLGEVPKDAALVLVELRDGDNGAKRALIKFKGADGAEQQGWVTSVLKDGTENLAPAGASTAASAPSKRSSSPTTEPPPDLNAASAGAGAGAGASTAKPAAAAAVSSTPRSIPLKATPRAIGGMTPRAAPGGGMTPRAAPGGGMTPRAAPGGGMTPRRGGGSGGKEVLAPVQQAPPPAAVLGGPQGFLAQPESVRAPKSDGTPVNCVAISPPPLPGAPPPLAAGEKPPPPPEPLPPLPSEASLRFKPEGKRPVRDDGAPSRHSIPLEWTPTVEAVLLFNCCNARCALVSGEHGSFADAQDGLLKVVGGSQEALGRVLVSSEKGADFMTRLE